MGSRGFIAVIISIVCACGPAPVVTAHGQSLVAGRPYELHVPPRYDAARATPLVVMLHGFTDEPGEVAEYFRMREVADSETFLLALPAGTRDAAGNRFWSATDACCDFGGTGIDDVAYVNAVIDDAEARYHVDLKRVYVFGHSNGGFMALRLACELAPRIAAVAEHAGAAWLDPARCRPAAPVAVLAIHGDADPLVHYDGGTLDDATLAVIAKEIGIRLPKLVPGTRAYPSVAQTTRMWAQLDGCTGPLAATDSLDLDTSLAGDETARAAYRDCRDAAVEVWTMHGAGHMPALAKPPAPPAFADAVWHFFAAHPKP